MLLYVQWVVMRVSLAALRVHHHVADQVVKDPAQTLTTSTTMTVTHHIITVMTYTARAPAVSCLRDPCVLARH